MPLGGYPHDGARHITGAFRENCCEEKKVWTGELQEHLDKLPAIEEETAQSLHTAGRRL